MKDSLFLRALSCQQVERPPVWLMRQAGRYLPEYLSLRSRYSLSSLFHEPDLAVEVTLMPLRRFSLDAAIVFSDLLMPAEAFGKKVVYPETGGLFVLPTVHCLEDLPMPSKEEIQEKLFYVFKTIQELKKQLSIPLLGFCGAPFTLLYYLVGGKEEVIRYWIQEKKEAFTALLERVCEVLIIYAKLQFEAGVDALQIFDSWTHLLSPEEFKLFALPYWQKMQKALVGYPILFFSRSNSLYPELISSIHPQGISFDEGKPLHTLRKIVPQTIAVQGNFSPQYLLSRQSKDVYDLAKAMALSVKGEKGIIFNLGHGVLPKTPIENVEAFLQGLYSPAS